VARRLAERPVFVSSAATSPSAFAVLEAAQAGCALVLSDIPTFRELWDGAASSCRPRTTERSPTRSGAPRATPGHRARLGAAAARGRSRYTVEAMAAGTAAVYRPLLRRAEAPGETAAA
jgi:hypothetical protein